MPRVVYLLALSVGAVSAHDIITTKITFSKEISRLIYKRCATCHREGGAKLLKSAGDDEIHRVAGKTVASDSEAGHVLALQYLEAHAHGIRQNQISGEPVSDAHGQNPWQSAVREFKDHEDNEPNREDPQANDQQTLR